MAPCHLTLGTDKDSERSALIFRAKRERRASKRQESNRKPTTTYCDTSETGSEVVRVGAAQRAGRASDEAGEGHRASPRPQRPRVVQLQGATGYRVQRWWRLHWNSNSLRPSNWHSHWHSHSHWRLHGGLVASHVQSPCCVRIDRKCSGILCAMAGRCLFPALTRNADQLDIKMNIEMHIHPSIGGLAFGVWRLHALQWKSGPSGTLS